MERRGRLHRDGDHGGVSRVIRGTEQDKQPSSVIGCVHRTVNGEPVKEGKRAVIIQRVGINAVPGTDIAKLHVQTSFE